MARKEGRTGEEQSRLRTISKDELATILSAHGQWLKSDTRQGKRANLSETDLHGADLREIDLRGAQLYGTNLERAQLGRAHLENAYLFGALLKGADLSGAHLEEADLRGAHLDGANLHGARLYRANLETAHLKETKGLAQEQLDEAYGDVHTTLPEGLSIQPNREAR